MRGAGPIQRDVLRREDRDMRPSRHDPAPSRIADLTVSPVPRRQDGMLHNSTCQDVADRKATARAHPIPFS